MEKLGQITAENVGKILSERRKHAGLNLDEVAAKLNLSNRIVASIEAGDFEATPGPVFIRGYISSYARLLGLPIDQVLQEFDSLSIQTIHSKPMVLSSIIYHKHRSITERFLLWVTLGVILILVALVIIWWRTHNLIDDNEMNHSSFISHNSVTTNSHISSASTHDEDKLKNKVTTEKSSIAVSTGPSTTLSDNENLQKKNINQETPIGTPVSKKDIIPAISLVPPTMQNNLADENKQSPHSNIINNSTTQTEVTQQASNKKIKHHHYVASTEDLKIF